MARRRKKKQPRIFRIFLVVIALIAIFSGCIYGAYTLFTRSSPYINATPIPAATTIKPTTPSPKPVSTPTSSSKPTPSSKPTTTSSSKPTQTPKGGAPTSSPMPFSEYDYEEYGFSCPYPENFSLYSNVPGEGQSMVSADGGAYQDIFIDQNSSGSSTTDMRNFISKYPTAIIEQSHAGDGYYYVLLKNEGKYIYRYVAYTDGTAKGFEFGYDENMAEYYSGYPEEIRADFMLY